MYIVRSLIVICSMMVFASTANAAVKSTKAQSGKTKTTISIGKTVTKTVNINSSTQERLQKVKGVGKARAQAIIKYRKQNGKFKSIDDLLKVKARGIDKSWLKKVRGFLTM